MNPTVFEPIILIGGLLGVVMMFIAPISIYAIHQENKKRAMEHAERMRAIELGIWPGPHGLKDVARAVAERVQPKKARDDDSPAAMARRCYQIAGWTPFWAFLFGSWAFSKSIPVAIVIAGAVAAISMTSVICGTWLAHRASANADTVGANGFAAKPPSYDPDAFDVVGRRG